MRSILLFILVLSFSSFEAVAKVLPIEASLSDHVMAVADSPREVLRWVDSYQKTIDPKDHPREWVKSIIIRHYAYATRSELGDAGSSIEELQQALAIAEANSYDEEMIILLMQFMFKESTPETQAAFEKNLLRAIDKAQAIGNTQLTVRAMTEMAAFLHKLGSREAETLQYYRKAQDIIKNDPHFNRLEAAMTRVKVGLMLDDANMGGEKTIQTYEEVLKEFRELGLRQFQVIMIFNVAATLKIELDEKVKSKAYFQELVTLAPQIEDWQTYATTLAHLSDYDLEAKNYAAAEQKLDKAGKILSKQKDEPYLEFLIDFLSEYQRARKMWPEALKTLEEAELLLSQENVQRKTNLLEKKYKILARMGQFEQAYKILSKLHFEYKQDKQKQEQEGFDKLKVELGLAVEEEKTKNLEMKNQMQAEQIKNVRRLQIASLVLLVFFLAVMSLMVVAIRRGHAIKAAKEKMQKILETIDEGILSIAKNLQIIDEHSPFMQKLFPDQKLAGLDVVEGILRFSRMNEEELSIVRESLQASLGEEVLTWEFNSHNFPEELHLKDDRWISLHWQPMTEHGRIEKVLLAIRDVTARHELEEKVAKQQKIMQGMQRKMNEILSTRTQDVRRLLERLIAFHKDLQKDLQNIDSRPVWLRLIHTAKGEARGLGLKDLSGKIHQLEESLKRDDHEALAAAFIEYSDSVHEYKYLIRDVFGLEDQKILEDVHLLDVSAPLVTALRRQLQQAGLNFGGIDLQDRVKVWPAETLNALRHSLIHAVANAADHGYIIPFKAGHPLQNDPWFGIEAVDKDHCIQVIIRDHGRGVDIKKLAHLAQERGFTPSSTETIADVVFMDGASTAETVSETSGRGIGLSAVRSICRSTGGDAWFRGNDQGPGAMLILEFHPIKLDVSEAS